MVYLPLTVFAGLPVAAEALGYAGQVLPTSTGESKVELKLIVASVNWGILRIEQHIQTSLILLPFKDSAVVPAAMPPIAAVEAVVSAGAYLPVPSSISFSK